MRGVYGMGIGLVMVFSACQPKPQTSNSGDSSAVATTAAASAGPNTVTVHARDFSYDAPDRIPGGLTTFRLVNDGPGLHHLVLVRLDSAKTALDLQAALKKPGPLPPWAVLVGGPNAGDPTTETNATLDLAAGNYVMICFVDIPGGVPHFAKGMIRPLTVTPSTGPSAPPPTADVVVTLSDYKFDLSQPMTSGTHTIKVESTAGQPHELVLFRMDAGKSAKDLLGWMPKMQGPPPGHALGGVTPMEAGHAVYFTVNLTPGKYALFCFLPDAGDGKPHFVHGMMQSIDVT